MLGTLLVVFASGAFVGCGESEHAELGEHFKSFLHAESIQRYSCNSGGSTGSGEPIKTCDVTFVAKSTSEGTTGQSCQFETELEVHGTQPVFGDGYSVSAPEDCH